MDRRDYIKMNGDWFDSISENQMTVTVTLYDEDDEGDFEFKAEFPVQYEVCDLCNGKGSHVNPSIDSHGISSEEFYEDPDFSEEYFNGTYDDVCYQCNGKRVYPQLSDWYVTSKTLTEEQNKNLKLLYDKWQNDADNAREDAYIRRMGF